MCAVHLVCAACFPYSTVSVTFLKVWNTVITCVSSHPRFVDEKTDKLVFLAYPFSHQMVEYLCQPVKSYWSLNLCPWAPYVADLEMSSFLFVSLPYLVEEIGHLYLLLDKHRPHQTKCREHSGEISPQVFFSA